MLTQMGDAEDSCKEETRCSSSSEGMTEGMRGESGDKMLTDSDDHDRQHNCLDSGGGGG